MFEKILAGDPGEFYFTEGFSETGPKGHVVAEDRDLVALLARVRSAEELRIGHITQTYRGLSNHQVSKQE